MVFVSWRLVFFPPRLCLPAEALRAKTRALNTSISNRSSRVTFSSAIALAVLFLVVPTGTRAHTPSATYLSARLDGTNLTLRWDVALRDLHQGLGLDSNSVSRVPATELQRREEALALDVAAGLKLRANSNAVALVVTDYTALTLNDVEYARLLLDARELPPALGELELDARAVFKVDTNMHGFLRLEHSGRVDAVAFNLQQPVHRFDLAGGSGGWQRWLTFIWEGVWHIWIGFDHILFLIALLLPAVLVRKEKRWVPVASLRAAMWNVLGIVTAFTVAHSVTLSLAALEIVSLPSRLVESVIAASVALAAANNLWPVLRGQGWLVAGGFGLIHGFGFASVLADLGLGGGDLVAPLVGFNLGVELGQIAIVLVFVPVAYALRGTGFYRRAVLQAGSALVVALALYWMFERLFAAPVPS